MQLEELIIGVAAIIWGVILLAMRQEILELSREGGRGLRNRKILNAVLIAGIVLLPITGAIIILLRGL
ncbi:MAG: hypothetical protein SWK76_05765 [Actinomycetota bacterium]|nr:hypothetical protein [Actinomycetota bacterium]